MSGCIWIKLVIITQCQVYITLMTFSRPWVQRSRSQTTAIVIFNHYKEGFEPKLTHTKTRIPGIFYVFTAKRTGVLVAKVVIFLSIIIWKLKKMCFSCILRNNFFYKFYFGRVLAANMTKDPIVTGLTVYTRYYIGPMLRVIATCSF